jgi:cobalt-precorrin 5A hydrolase
MSGVLGIWSVRVEAERLGERLVQRLGGQLFRPWQSDEPQRTQFQRQFERHPQWVLIMAAGIATRFVDGLLRDKHHDPAVVVLDEGGRYAIALVGGHEAGANDLTYRVANAVGAIPVVTTATEATKPLVVGIGCRKGVSEEQVERAIRHALAQRAEGDARDPAGEFNPIRELVTVDLKAGEPALVSFAQRHVIPLRVIAKHQVVARPWVTERSKWVRQSVGLDGVCEPCALIACTRGRLVVPKTTLDGVAVAIVSDDWRCDP